MIINGTDYGYRLLDNVVEEPQRWQAIGISQAGDVSVLNFARKEQDVPITFPILTTSQKNALKAYLMDTVRPWGQVTITPDASDDLGIGASGPVTLYFMTFKAIPVGSTNQWQVDLTFKYYTT